MKVLITGTSQGIGRAIAQLFLAEGHNVIGIDRQASSIADEAYTHIEADIRHSLPDIGDVEILINNAGTQNEDDIDVNLKALISDHIFRRGVAGAVAVFRKYHKVSASSLNALQQVNLPLQNFKSLTLARIGRLNDRNTHIFYPLWLLFFKYTPRIIFLPIKLQRQM